LYNGIYPAGISPYIPQIKKRNTLKVQADEEKPLKPNYDEESSNRQSNSGAQKIAPALKQVNIKQILIDFENTLKAIGANKEIEEEVTGYLGLVEKQAEKEAPSKKIIIGNLRNASEILDGYIADALGKKSTVVKDWVDALLLQPINYKIDKSITAGFIETVHPEISAKQLIKENSQEDNSQKIQETTETQATTNTQSNDPNIQKNIDKAKELANSGQPQKAMGIYARALSYAKKIEDINAQASIFLDVGELQDKGNEVEASLKCFNNAVKLSSKVDNKDCRAKAHAGMGKIYDDFGNYNSAMEHYFAALSFDGENEDLKSQAKILNNIGNMEKLRFENKEALDYYKLGFGLAKQVPDIDGMGTILSNTAAVYKDTGNPTKALKYYKDSIILDQKSGKTLDVAKSYEKAGDLMIELGKPKKALDLYQKSFKKAQVCDNSQDFVQQINSKMKDLQAS
jgi:tetratricopeptide (TPR) repeat protein